MAASFLSEDSDYEGPYKTFSVPDEGLSKLSNGELDDLSLSKLALEEDRDDSDSPIVFFCEKCKLPVGDSLSWAGSEPGQSQIVLNRVTDNVLIEKESHLYEPSKRSRCKISHLSCRSCHSVLGLVYLTTPRSMDHKRSKFFLNAADLDSYVLGSANQQVSAENTEKRVTLEDRITVEQQMTEMRSLMVNMAHRLMKIESKLK